MQGHPPTARSGAPSAGPSRAPPPLSARQGERILPVPPRRRRRPARDVTVVALIALAALVGLAWLAAPREEGGSALPMLEWLHVDQPTQVWDLAKPAPVETAAIGEPPPPPAPQPPEPDRDILEIERLLQRLSFAPGPVDGTLDAATEEAIRQYEAAAGLPVTGEPSPALLEELRAVAAGVPAPGAP